MQTITPLQKESPKVAVDTDGKATKNPLQPKQPANNPLQLQGKAQPTNGHAVIQRAIKIGTETFGDNLIDKKHVNGTLMVKMKKMGYSNIINFLKKVVEGLAGEKLPFGREFKDFNELIEYGIDQKWVQQDVPRGQPVKERAENLGDRPKFSPGIEKIRTTYKEAYNSESKTVAIRHVIPSHLLGYAAENVKGNLDELPPHTHSTTTGLSIQLNRIIPNDQGSSCRIMS